MPTGYIIELAPNRRAGCKNKECKDQGSKFEKDEVRFGVLVTFQEHTSWSYKHWGCVTPEQIKNLKSYLDGDMDLLEGYENLPKDIQEQVDFALENGHVPDEVWKGDVEKNRPGEHGFRNSAAYNKKKAKEEAEDAEDDDGSPKPAKKKRGRAAKDDGDAEAPAPKKRGKKAAAKEEEASDGEAPAPAPKKRGKKAAVKEENSSVKAENVASLKIDDGEAPAPAPKKRGRKAAVKKEEHASDEDMVDAPAPAPKKAKAKKAAAAKKEDVEDDNEADEEEVKPKKQQAKKSATKKEEKTGAVRDEQVDEDYDVEEEVSEPKKTEAKKPAAKKKERAYVEPTRVSARNAGARTTYAEPKSNDEFESGDLVEKKLYGKAKAAKEAREVRKTAAVPQKRGKKKAATPAATSDEEE